MKFISMFSGIEAASCAFGPLGWEAVAFSEIEPFPCAVLKHHYPNVPNLGDITKVNWKEWRGKADVVCGGSPCQSFSIAGLRGGISDERGNLALEYVKAVHAIHPRWIIYENVPGMLSDKSNAFGCILAGLSGADEPLMPGTEDGKWRSAGIVSGPEYGLAWRVLNAEFFGVPQRRERVSLLDILEIGAVPRKYYLSPMACRGILRRAAKRGKALPERLRVVLEQIANPSPSKPDKENLGGKGYLGSEDKAFTVATGNDQTICIQGSVIGRSDTAGPEGPGYKTDGKSFTVDTKSPHAVVFEIGPGGGKQTEVCPTLDARCKDGPIRNQIAPCVMATGQGGAEIMEDKAPTLNCNHEAPILFRGGGILKHDRGH